MKPEEICIIVPTRGRPQSIAPLLQAWRETEAEAHLVIAVDNDDPTRSEYRAEFDRHCQPHWNPNPFSFWVGHRRRLAGTLNHVAAKLLGDMWDYKAIGFMGDDHRPRTRGWDRRFAECLSGGTGIVYGNDLLVGEKFPTAVVMTSDIPRTLGYMCPPGLVHLCLDLVWRDLGEAIGRITYLHDVIIEHMHPANGKSVLDAGYTECNSKAQVEADTAAYMKYKVDGFDADVEKLRRLL